MTNAEKYNEVFMNIFAVDADMVPTLAYQSIPEWDSVGHMSLIAELESAFDILFETDDIIELNSYDKGIEILKKYEVEI